MSAQPGYEIRRLCLWCGEGLSPQERRFCSDLCRNQASRVDPCIYCGLPADTEDHVIPRIYRTMVEEHGGWRDEYARVADTVPACGECNSIAGTLVFGGIVEKREYVHKRLREKYGHVLAMPQWAEDEIEELGRTLRLHVINGQELASLTRSRLRWPEQ